MEGKALHDFNASNNEELTFRKGNVLKVINTDDDINWYTAELDGKTGFIPSNYLEMQPFDWYHGKISRLEAESRLMACTFDNAFLVRESESAPGTFSLSVRVQNRAGTNVQHFKILKDESLKYFLWVMKFNSLNELINYHKTQSVSRSEDIFLKGSLSRTGQVTSLVGGGAPAPTAPRTQARAPAAAPAAAASQSRPAQARTPAAAPAAKPAANLRTVTAQYVFEPAEAGELRFRKGDIITVLDSSDANWWKGQCHGETGLFPASYVK